MNLMKRQIVAGISLLSVLIAGIFLGIFYVSNSTDKKDDHSKYQQLLAKYDSLKNQSKQWENRIEDKTVNQTNSPEQNIPEKSDNETKNISEVIQKFMDTFDNLSTDDYEEKMVNIYPLMTDNAQKNLQPYYKEDNNMQKIESHLEQSTNYILKKTEDKAEVLSLAILYKTFNGEQPYINRTIYQTKLIKEDDIWKIDSRKQYIVNDHFPKEMFNK